MPARGPRPEHKGKGKGKGKGRAVASAAPTPPPPPPPPAPGSDGAAGPALLLHYGPNDAQRSRLSSMASNVLSRMTGEYVDVDDGVETPRNRRSAYMYATTPFVTMAANGNGWSVDEAMHEEDEEDEEEHGGGDDASRMGSVASLDLYGGGGGSTGSIYGCHAGDQAGDVYTPIGGDASSSEDEGEDEDEDGGDYLADLAPVEAEFEVGLARPSTASASSAKQSIVSLVSLAFPDTYPGCDDVDTSCLSPADYRHKHTPETDAALGFVAPRLSHFRTSRSSRGSRGWS